LVCLIFPVSLDGFGNLVYFFDGVEVVIHRFAPVLPDIFPGNGLSVALSGDKHTEVCLYFLDLVLSVNACDGKGVFEPFGRRFASLPRRDNPVASNAYDDCLVVV